MQPDHKPPFKLPDAYAKIFEDLTSQLYAVQQSANSASYGISQFSNAQAHSLAPEGHAYVPLPPSQHSHYSLSPNAPLYDSSAPYQTESELMFKNSWDFKAPLFNVSFGYPAQPAEPEQLDFAVFCEW